jgi:hydroxymethylbilane synthase
MAFRLRIGSRPSRLALTQAEFVRASLSALLPGLSTELVSIRTSGDRIMTPSLAGEGGKGLFIKELEQALSGRRADIAVHSMKDLPAVLSPAYRIAAVPERENPCDALVTRDATGIRSLPPGARLGTSSSRRRFEALKLNPALEVVPLRGNVDTRLQRVLSGELEATILAMAGLKRLGRLKEVRYEELDEREFVPAAAQAALAIETLADGPAGGSAEIERALCALNDPKSACETAAERAFLAAIGASCVTPVGVKATLSEGTLELRAILFSPDGEREMADEIRTPAASADAAAGAALGTKLGERMLGRGARDLLGDG